MGHGPWQPDTLTPRLSAGPWQPDRPFWNLLAYICAKVLTGVPCGPLRPGRPLSPGLPLSAHLLRLCPRKVVLGAGSTVVPPPCDPLPRQPSLSG